MQVAPTSTIAPGIFFRVNVFPPPLIQEEQVFSLLLKECALNIRKVPTGGLPGYKVVKFTDRHLS